ncbi:hypothetical protein [Spirosoma flavus]
METKKAHKTKLSHAKRVDRRYPRAHKTISSEPNMKEVSAIVNSSLLGVIGGGGIGALISFTGAVWGGAIGLVAVAVPEVIKLYHEHK